MENNVIKSYKNILFDFDGVIVDSNQIRTLGFHDLFNYSNEQERLTYLAYIERNKGGSRYDKIRYYYEYFRNELVDESKITDDALRYSVFVKEKVINVAEISGISNFLQQFYQSKNLIIISSSDEVELRDICLQRGLSPFFQGIYGSPVTKKENIKKVIKDFNCRKEETVYVGDDEHDYVAASSENIDFIGFRKENFLPEDRFCIVEDFQTLISYIN